MSPARMAIRATGARAAAVTLTGVLVKGVPVTGDCFAPAATHCAERAYWPWSTMSWLPTAPSCPRHGRSNPRACGTPAAGPATVIPDGKIQELLSGSAAVSGQSSARVNHQG